MHSTRFEVGYQYDGAGALAAVVDDLASPSVSYYTIDAQDALGRARGATLGNDLVEKLGYSRATHRLVSIATGPGQTATLQDLAYDWDLAGNLIERIDDSVTLTRTDVFSYDALDRLEEVERNSSSIFAVAYDEGGTGPVTGNIHTKTGVSGTYGYGANAGPHAVTSIGSMTFGYDANGNMTSRDGETIDWTSFNKPEHIAHSSESDRLQCLHRDHQTDVVATTDDRGDVVAEYDKSIRTSSFVSRCLGAAALR